ncbi:helix-turn-helix domain-containing protein [Intestinimonas sp. HCP28S3_D6]|uniref:helix-turn-helix domain-containing protein n=1 Tax=Intestinimonas sp. HCP28S3_D6 TaxID=3438942 RepID=UPI003F8A21E1
MSSQPLRRNPVRYRFALPNQVWGWKLKPPAFAVLAYLCWLHSHGDNRGVPDPGSLAARLHMSPAMAAASLGELLRRGLVTQDLTPTLPRGGGRAGRFFTLPYEIFCLDLGHGVIAVYAYLLCCEDRRTHQCHPSYATISAATGLAVNTVAKHIGKLADQKFITVERTSYVDDKGMKWNGNNCYTILPIRAAVEAFHRKQLEKLEETVEKQQIAELLTAK